MFMVKDIICKAFGIIESTILMIANISDYEEFK